MTFREAWDASFAIMASLQDFTATLRPGEELMLRDSIIEQLEII